MRRRWKKIVSPVIQALCVCLVWSLVVILVANIFIVIDTKFASSSSIIRQAEKMGPQRPIFGNDIGIYGEITKEKAIRIIRELKSAENDSTVNKICIFINSPGGNAVSGRAICRAMKECRKPIEIRVGWQACSAAACILSCGTKGKRYVYEHSLVVIHRSYWGGEPSRADKWFLWLFCLADTKYRKVLQNRLLSENTGQSIKRVATDLDNETWFSGKKAVEYGIADSVIYSY